MLASHVVLDPYCDNYYGSTCVITCLDRYELHGNKQVTCEYDQEENRLFWTDAQATCQQIAGKFSNIKIFFDISSSRMTNLSDLENYLPLIIPRYN